MTRKDYQELASIWRKMIENDPMAGDFVEEFAVHLKNDNVRFNEPLFLQHVFGYTA